MQTTFSFVLDGKIETVDCRELHLSPTTTVLNYLRGLPRHNGVKEGCAEGDCGACTVVLGELSGNAITYKAVDSCLLFLPMLQGKQLITVENLRGLRGELHPVQQAMIDAYGSQCGFCTPGIVMSLFALYQNRTAPAEPEIRRALAGNLCRCTGYRPILDAAKIACGAPRDRASETNPGALHLLREIRNGSIHIATENQTYSRPVTLHEAIEIKRHNPEAIALNGATDVALRVTKSHERLPFVLDLSGVAELRGLSEENGQTVVSSGTSIEEFAALCRDRFPALSSMLDVFGSLQIRNLATVGGNLGTASPVGDLMPALIAHDARIALQGPGGRRLVSSSDFVVGYRRTVAAPDELITAVLLPPIPAGVHIRSYKVSRRRDVDIAAVSGGFRLDLEKGNRIKDIVIAFGGMADHVRRAERTETHLRGRIWDRSTVEEAMSLVDREFTPISDVRGSAAMRTIAARNLLLKFWTDSTGNGGRP